MSFFDFNCDSCCLMIHKTTVKHEAKRCFKGEKNIKKY